MRAPHDIRESEVADVAQSDTKCVWRIGTETQDVHHVTMLKPKKGTCNTQCPWREENHGKTVDFYYDHEAPGIQSPETFTFAVWKRVDIWENDLRYGLPGYGGLCHVRLKGTERTQDDTWKIVSRQCTGALVMQQRELLRQIECGRSALTPKGAAHVAADMLGRDVSVDEVLCLDIPSLLAVAHPSLLDPAIGCSAVAPPLSEQEIQNWQLKAAGENGLK